jgi:hypothetical protein
MPLCPPRRPCTSGTKLRVDSLGRAPCLRTSTPATSLPGLWGVGEVEPDRSRGSTASEPEVETMGASRWSCGRWTWWAVSCSPMARPGHTDACLARDGRPGVCAAFGCRFSWLDGRHMAYAPTAACQDVSGLGMSRLSSGCRGRRSPSARCAAFATTASRGRT